MSRQNPHPYTGRKRSLLISCVVACFALQGLRASEAGDDLLQIAVAGHRQAVESIRSIHARMRIETSWQDEKTGKVLSISRRGEWWQLGSKCRWKELLVERGTSPKLSKTGDLLKQTVDRETDTDGAIVDGLQTELISRRQSDGFADTGAVLEVPENEQATFVDLWSRGAFMVQDGPRLTVLQLLEHRDWVKSIELAHVGGLRCLHATCARPDGLNVEVWLSIEHGFLVNRMLVGRATFAPGTRFIEYETDSFQDCGDQVFFPRHSVMRIYHEGDAPGKPTGGVTNTDFDNLSANEGIPDEVFRVVIPEGTRTIDKRNKTVFVMGTDGAPSPSHPIEPLITLSNSQQVAVASSESRSWLTWFIIVAIVTVAAGLVIWRTTVRARHAHVPRS
jgi:hypothetical protein